MTRTGGCGRSPDGPLEKNGAHLRLQVLGQTIEVRYEERDGRLKPLDCGIPRARKSSLFMPLLCVTDATAVSTMRRSVSGEGVVL